MARTGLGVALLAAAFFFFLATVALGAASTAMPDWVYMGGDGDNTKFLHEGLWSTCWGTACHPIQHYYLTCQTLLDTVRAFSIMTIIFAFLTLMALLTLLMIEIDWLWILTLILALITMCVSIVPWTVYFAFVGVDAGCVLGYTKGAGWALAVAAFPCAAVGFFLVCLWLCLGRPAAGEPVPPHMHIQGDRSRYGVWLLGISAFFYMLEWVLSTAAAPATNWATLYNAGVHQGLWVTCERNKWGDDTCKNLPSDAYEGQCLAFLNTTRAFNILSILLGFFAMVAVIAMLFVASSFCWIITLIIAILAVLVAVIPWTVYGLGLYGLALFSNCVPGYLQPGGGWALAVASFVMGAVGLAFLIAWLVIGTRMGYHAPAVAGAPKGLPVDGTYPLTGAAATGTYYPVDGAYPSPYAGTAGMTYSQAYSPAMAPTYYSPAISGYAPSPYTATAAAPAMYSPAMTYSPMTYTAPPSVYSSPTTFISSPAQVVA